MFVHQVKGECVLSCTGSGERIKEERTRLGFSQTDFAVRGGVEKRAQIYYEQSTRRPDLDYLCQIASLGVDVLYIVTGKRQNMSPGEFRPDLLQLVIEGVEELLQANRLRVVPAKKSELILVLYDHYSKTGQPVEKATTGRFLRLVKQSV